MTKIHEQENIWMKMAIKLSKIAVEKTFGGPFGCVIVKDGKVIGKGFNQVTSTNDPTAHAEIMAIRDACHHLHSFQLEGCEIYSSCEPCPMCLGAIYWARPSKIYFANTRQQAAAIGFDDAFIYNEIALPIEKRNIECIHLSDPSAAEVFKEWENKTDKTAY